jgi:hypothetical protein
MVGISEFEARTAKAIQRNTVSKNKKKKKKSSFQVSLISHVYGR